MTIKTFIEKAIEGGWGKDVVGVFGETVLSNAGKNFKADVFLDPLAWQAVGKVEGWKVVGPGKKDTDHMPEAFYFQESMIEALWEGKTIEQYLETL